MIPIMTTPVVLSPLIAAMNVHPTTVPAARPPRKPPIHLCMVR